MSLETLLEAVKYVEKSESSSIDKETKPKISQMTSAPSNGSCKRGQSNDSATKHWRKRAIAQSFMESQNKASESCRDSGVLTSHNSSSVISSVVKTPLKPLGEVDNPITNIAKTAVDSNILKEGKSNCTIVTNGALHSPVSVSATDQSKPIVGLSHSAGNMAHTSASVSCPIIFDDIAGCRSYSHAIVSGATLLQSPRTSEVQSIFRRTQGSEPKSFGATQSQDDVLVMTKLVNAYSDSETATRSDHQSSPDEYSIIRDKRLQTGTVTREAHNLLEKNRRAHLKECFDNLRNVVPNLGSRKVSNLAILREALKFVQTLKRKEQKQQHELESLVRAKIEKQQKVTALRRNLSSVLDKAVIDGIVESSESNGTVENGAHVRLPEKNNVPVIISSSNLSKLSDKGSEANIQTTKKNASSINKQGVEAAGKLEGLPLGKTVSGSFSKHEFKNAMQLPHDADTCSTLSCSPHPTWASSSFQKINASENGAVPGGTRTLIVSSCNGFSTSDKRDIAHLNSTNTSNPIGPRPLLTERLSQMSANFMNGLMMSRFKSPAMCATSYHVPNIKAYKTRDLGSGITSYIDGGHASNPLKIVVKPVDSAKQQARVTKVQKNDNSRKAENSTISRCTSPSKSSNRVHQAELIYRPRSSVTPPPPSNITPYFPRFSIGSGGSPPLTTIVPNKSDKEQLNVYAEHEKDTQHTFATWKPMSADSNGHETRAQKTSKRKVTSDERGLTKLTKRAVDAAPATLPESPMLNSETDSETETSPSIRSHHKLRDAGSAGPVVSTHLNFPTLSNQGVIFPQVPRKNKSVTQVCYSTLVKAARPAISSTLLSHSAKSQPDQVSSAQQTLQPTLKYMASKLSVFNPNLQLGANIQSRIPHVAYQIVQPTFINPTVIQPPLSRPFVNLQENAVVTSKRNNVGENRIGMISSSENLKNAESPSTATVAPRNSMSVSCVSQSDPQIGNAPQAQMPQIQYVIPMGYAGMMGGAGASAVGFSPSIGGIMQVAPMPQNANWSYVIPQNMVFTAESKAPEASAAKEDKKKDRKQAVESAAHTASNNTASVTNQNAEKISLFSTPGKVVNPVMSVRTSEPAAMNDKMETLQLPKAVQPQFQLMSQNFQTASHIMVPVGGSGPNGGYIIGGAPNIMPTNQGVMAGGSPDGGVGYGIPMNIVGYPMQIAGASPMQFAALPEGSLSFPRGMAYGMSAQVIPTEDKRVPSQDEPTTEKDGDVNALVSSKR